MMQGSWTFDRNDVASEAALMFKLPTLLCSMHHAGCVGALLESKFGTGRPFHHVNL
jgi:hypothetical protein